MEPRSAMRLVFTPTAWLIAESGPSHAEAHTRSEGVMSWRDSRIQWRLVAHVALLSFLVGVGSIVGCGGREQPAPAIKPRVQRLSDVTKPFHNPMARYRNPTEADTPELTRLFASGDDDVRKDAVLALGTIGSDDCIGAVVAALSDDDDYVRSYAMMGIERGIAAERCTPEFLEAVFPALIKLLDRRDSSISGTAPVLLLAINAERAIPILLSPQYFTSGNRELHYILRALNFDSYQIPHDKLLPLLDELKLLADKYPYDDGYAEALVAYGNHPDNDAEARIRTELDSTNGWVRKGAAKGLTRLSGMDDPYQHAARMAEKVGFADLTEPQKHYLAVSIYGWQVSNGGHSQYFFNSSGNYWKSALSGLHAIGAKTRSSVLEDAVARFGGQGPPEDRAVRIAALQNLEGGRKMAFDDLDERFYDAAEDFDVLLPLYAIENKSHFTSPPEN